MKGFQNILQYLIVLLFVIAILDTIVIVRLADRAVRGAEAADHVQGGVIGTVSMTVQNCGDSLVHGTEQCDGNNTNGSTCISLGYDGGTLACKSNCSYNTSACTSQDTDGPVVDLQYPLNNTQLNQSNGYFVYNTTDLASGIDHCDLFISQQRKKRNNRVDESIYQYFSLTGMTSGDYTWQVNCTDNTTSRNEGGSVLRNFSVVFNSTDEDDDGIDDSDDSFIGTNISINTSTLSHPLIAIGNSTNLSRNFTGSQNVSVLDGDTQVLTLSFNFNTATLNLMNFRFEKQNTSSTIGQFETANLNLPAGVTKTVYLDKVDTAITTICIRDLEDISVNDISADCSDSSETFLHCDGTTLNGYSCTDLGDRFQISGLQHSVGQQQENGPTTPSSNIIDHKGKSAQYRANANTPSTSAATPATPNAPAAPRAVSPAIAAARPSSTPQPSAPTKSDLFDVAVDTVLEFKEMMAGGEVFAQISLFYLGDERINKRVDVAVYYAILDDNEQIIAEKLETVGIQTRATIVGKLTVPPDAEPGKYWFYSRINVGKEVAEAFDRFIIIEEATVEQPWPLFPQQYLIILVFILSIFLLIVVHHQYRLEKHLAEHHGRISEDDLMRLGELVKRVEGKR